MFSNKLSTLLAFIGLLIASPVSAAPVWLNSGAAMATGNAVTGSATITTGATTADIPPGSLVAITGSVRVSANTLNSCTDSASNSYTVVGQTTSVIIVGAAISYTTTDLPIGSTFSCTWSSSTGGKAIIVNAASGVPKATSDQVVAATGTGTGTLTVGPTPTLAGANDAVFGAITLTNAGTITESSGWTTSFNNTTSSNQHMAVIVPGSSSAISYAPSTSGTSGTWGGIIVAVKPGGLCTRGLLHVGSC